MELAYVLIILLCDFPIMLVSYYLYYINLLILKDLFKNNKKEETSGLLFYN